MGRRTGAGGLTIRGVTTTRHDDALSLLVDLSTSFFLDIDFSYGLTARLNPALDVDLLKSESFDRDEHSRKLPRFPVARHNSHAASLYLYARSLIGTPLLEYLAYYQVMEFFMPMYARSNAIQRLRNTLKDPRFDYGDDVALGRIVDMLVHDGRNSMDERSQLEATLRACIDDDDVQAYLVTHPAGAEALADRARLPEVHPINPRDRQVNLTDQVARRIYGLRCRIVHAKEAGDGRAEPIRPFGREVQLLSHDLSLVRFAAQNVLIASGTPTAWR
jgi:hypothetical protein